MQEIRFRHSEEVADQYLKGLFESGLMVTTGTFMCYKCLVMQRFEELVCKPIDI